MGNTTETLKHKPSKKVALEEVLASLQDLVNNEFADDAANQAESGQTPNILSNAHPGGAPRRRGRPRKHPLPEIPEIKEAPAVPVETGAGTNSEAVDYTYSQEQADLFGKSPEKSARKRQKPAPPQPQGSQAQAGRSTEAKKPARPAKPVRKAPLVLGGELETPAKRANLRVVESQEMAPPKQTETNEFTSDMSSKSSNTAENRSPQNNLDWADDIPVLTEVVDPSELNIGDLKDVVDQSLARKDLAPEAREIAVKVAAKLNIEMRKEGGSQLDVKTIMRLQALLKEALEPKG